jgi:FemAB-related protein (PEP-CTERM system-associated)
MGIAALGKSNTAALRESNTAALRESGTAPLSAGDRATHPAVGPSPALELRRDLDPVVWDAFVDRHPDATVYHLSAWTDLIEDVFRHRAERLAIVAPDGAVVGVLPVVFFQTPLFGRFATSMPFVNYGGVAADSPAAAAMLLAAAVAGAQARRASYLELRHARRVFTANPFQAHKVAMVLPLQPDSEAQFNGLDRKLRNQIRKAEKSGFAVRIGGVELLDDFHAVLSENMRDLGSPVHGRRLFERILTAFPGRSRLFCVSLGDVPVAASLVLWHRDRLEVPWASALRRYNALCPNLLLYWEMLKFGIGRGFGSFDFGRSTPNGGTFHFKKQWGAQPQQLFWEYWLADGAALPDRSPSNPKFSAAIALWQRLPVFATQALGPLLVRNIP